jgi:hypothetical protein
LANKDVSPSEERERESGRGSSDRHCILRGENISGFGNSQAGPACSFDNGQKKVKRWEVNFVICGEEKLKSVINGTF